MKPALAQFAASSKEATAASSSAKALLLCLMWLGSNGALADRPVVRDQPGFPLVRIEYLVSKRKGGEARRLIDQVKPTAANKNLIHIWRGFSYRCEREPELAVAEFDQCTSFAEARGWTNLIACSYGQTEHFDRAIKILTAAIAETPSASGLYADRADYYCALGQFDKAVPDYKRAAAGNTERKRLYLTIAAEVLRRQGKLKEAMAVLDEGLKFPDRLSDGKYWLCRAQIETQQQHWQEGEKNCTIGLNQTRKASAKNKSAEEIAMAHLLLERAKCYKHLGKSALAEADLREHQKFSAETEDEILGKFRR